jgi:hypothetical protein
MKKKSSECLGCGYATRKGCKVCQSCYLKQDVRDRLNIRTASDYSLSKDDWLVNCLSFIHACGQLNDFIDKVDSDVMERMMSPFGYMHVNLDKLIVDPSDLYPNRPFSSNTYLS